MRPHIIEIYSPKFALKVSEYAIQQEASSHPCDVEPTRSTTSAHRY